ncbi:MAG: M23 family metallopeptidase [Caulobacterales bacterium]
MKTQLYDAFWPSLSVLILALVASLNFSLSSSIAPPSEQALPTKAERAPFAPFIAGSPRPRSAARALAIPVDGVLPNQLSDTWGAARSEGRTHQGVDILAAAGTPVRAVAPGRIVRFYDSQRGGITIYQFDAQERLVFYYAHLQVRAPHIAEGQYVEQGQLIGFVGSTGNATTPHLHFEIQRLGAEKQWWRAEALNPYPYLLSGELPP